MRRDQLEHAIRTACQIIGKPEVIVVGSQSILGTFLEDQLPTDATMSVEIENFVAALVRSALVDRKTILTRLSGVDERYRPAAEVAAPWLRAL
jgi:predicted NBD/HSP70 family sugar kinase